MSYQTSFLDNYPTSYRSTKLFSDDLVANTSIDPLYTPPSTYLNNSRLLSDDFLHDPISFPRTTTFSNYTPRTYRLPPETYQPTFQVPSSPVQSSFADRKTSPKEIPNPPVEKENHQTSISHHQWLTEEPNKSNSDDENSPSPVPKNVEKNPSGNLPTINEKKPSENVSTNIEKPSKTHKGKDEKAEAAFYMRHNSYFDLLFQGNLAPKTSANPPIPPSASSPPQYSKVRPKPATVSVPHSERPKPTPPKQPLPISIPSPRDPTLMNTNERYREALQKFRSDRAEQQQRESSESTAKRLNYGKYVRQSSKDVLLRNVIKPLPWTDFMYLKKGNVYSLTKLEKKELHDLSKSYGEKIRQKNFPSPHGSQTVRAPPPPIVRPPSPKSPSISEQTFNETSGYFPTSSISSEERSNNETF